MTNSPQHGSITQLTFERTAMKRKYNKPTQEQLSKLEWLVDKGMSVTQAAGVCGLSRTTAYEYLKLNKAPVKPQTTPKTRSVQKRTKKQMRKDSPVIRDMLAEGKSTKQIASEMGLSVGSIEHQIMRYKLRSKAKRKPRIVYAKPTFWQKCKRIISNIWG